MKRTALLTVAVLALAVAAQTRAAEAAVKYAVLVGVKEYEHPKLRPLKFAENDVDQLARKLRAGGFQVVQLSDSPGEKDGRLKPTRGNIVRELDAVLNKCKRKDLVLVALSGHGVQPFGSKENFFCPTDARVQDLKTMIGMAELYEKLDRSAAESKLIVADACRDDPAAGKGITKVPLPPEGVGVLLSCSPGEQAYEKTELRHGVFYYYLLDGLSGKAMNDQGEITFGLLAEYVQRRVSRTVPTLIGDGAKQSPNLVVNISGESPMLLKGKAIKSAVTETAPAPVAGGTARTAGGSAAVVGAPFGREIVGTWVAPNTETAHFRQDGSVVLTMGPLYLKGIFTCTDGIVDISFTDVKWDIRWNVAWADASKNTLTGQTVETTLPGTKSGGRFSYQRSNRPEPAVPPTRQEMVGTWVGGNTAYTLNADHTFIRWEYRDGTAGTKWYQLLTGKYTYNGNIMAVTYNDTNLWSMGLMTWADQARTTVRSTIILTNVQGVTPGTSFDFQRSR